MKTMRLIALLMLSLTLTLLGSACGMLDALEDRVEDRLNAAEDRVEDAIEQAIDNPNKNKNQNQNQSNITPYDELLAKESAQTIALDHAGLDAADVTGLRASYEVDDGVPEYEVEFYHDYVEYDYTIHAKTGAILSYDRDR